MTPMMEQYFEVKDKYKDYILFYRLGDFYEMFFEDAQVKSCFDYNTYQVYEDDATDDMVG